MTTLTHEDVEYLFSKLKEKFYLVEKGIDIKSELKDREIHIEKIIDDVCELLQTKRELLNTKIKIRQYTETRMTIYYIIKQLYPMVSYSKIGSYFNRGHSSVLQQMRVTESALEVDKVFKMQMDKLINKFKSEMQNETC